MTGCCQDCLFPKVKSRGISKVGELFSSPGPQLIPRPPINFMGPCLIAGSQIINDRVNVLSMISCFFFNFAKFCKSIRHCEFMIVKMCNLNDLNLNRITIAKVANLLSPRR